MKTTVAVLALVAALSALPARAEPAASDAAQWLALIDRGAYGESWTAAGTLFRAHLSQAEWAGKVRPTRAPLGPVVSRTLSGETEAKTLPGAPDGDYRVLSYATRFANKAAATETVVLALEPAGWRVDGYFIR